MRYFSPRLRLILAACLVLTSGMATAIGMKALAAFNEGSGMADAAPLVWPASSALRQSGKESDLLVFVHPFCGCTSATLAELERLEARTEPRLRPAITFVLFRPDGEPGWDTRTDIHRFTRLQGARAVWDRGGREARRFGAKTSGYAMLYGGDGGLLFRGGITGARGHEGENEGLDQLRLALTAPAAPGAPKSVRQSRVFGCAIGGPEGNRS